MLVRSNVAFERRNGTTSRAQVLNNQTTSGQFNESTKKLFKAIDDENLEDFKLALEEGADVNAFDEEGMTPLMSIITNLSAGSEREKEYQNMVRLLLLQQSIDVNICEQDNSNTALHLAMFFQQKKVLQRLLNHPNINTNLTNKARQNPEKCARQNRAEYLIREIQKAQTGKEFLNALSNGSICRAKILLNQPLNPNCWKRNLNGEIETPLSLIIRSCLERIEVLTKLLKHKELDFSQIKPIPAIEQLKQIIKQDITERLTDAINERDLDDVKELVEDNCFINRAIVAAALRGVNDPIESIKNYLDEKFSTNAARPVENIPAGFEGFVQELVDELERTKAQLAAKEQELDRVVSEKASETDKVAQLKRDLGQIQQEKLNQQTRISALTDQVTQLTRENDQLRTQNQDLNKSLNDENKKSFKSSTQNGYAVASFVLSVAFAIGACLTILNLEICIPLAVAAFVFLTIGFYCSYKASTVLSDVTNIQFGNVIGLGRN